MIIIGISGNRECDSYSTQIRIDQWNIWHGRITRIGDLICPDHSVTYSDIRTNSICYIYIICKLHNFNIRGKSKIITCVSTAIGSIVHSDRTCSTNIWILSWSSIATDFNDPFLSRIELLVSISITCNRILDCNSTEIRIDQWNIDHGRITRIGDFVCPDHSISNSDIRTNSISYINIIRKLHNFDSRCESEVITCIAVAICWIVDSDCTGCSNVWVLSCSGITTNFNDPFFTRI